MRFSDVNVHMYKYYYYYNFNQTSIILLNDQLKLFWYFCRSNFDVCFVIWNWKTSSRQLWKAQGWRMKTMWNWVCWNAMQPILWKELVVGGRPCRSWYLDKSLRLRIIIYNLIYWFVCFLRCQSNQPIF